MKIDQVTIYKILLPFSGDFSHSKKKGSFSENVIVEIVGQEGRIKGYGEGAPREYVTGESQESVVSNIQEMLNSGSFPWELNDISQVWAFIEEQPGNKEYNSAVCALEIALLDALGKKQNRNILEYFNKDNYVPEIKYGGGIPLGSKKRRLEVCHLLKRLGINQLRIKFGNDLEANTNAIHEVNNIFGDYCDLRVDVNGGWDYHLAIEHLDLLKKHGVKVVEQPLQPVDKGTGDFYEEIHPCGIVLMADESVCSISDLEKMISDGWYSMVNIRLSKCGGFKRSLDMLKRLRAEGLSFQIGCQLGETGILSASGRVLGLLSGDALYYDGSYDKYLLNKNITTNDVSFGGHGLAGPIEGPGLGVCIDSDNLNYMSSNCSISYTSKY